MQKKGFMVVQHDTADLRLVHNFLHGDHPATVASGGGSTGGKAVSSNSSGKLPVNGKGGSDPSAANGAPVLHSHAYRVSFVNASDQVQITADKALPSYNNYFIGNRSQWVSNCKIYQGVVYKDIYPGIDVHYYTDAGFLKYDIIVHPGANPDQIIMKYEGQNKLSIRKGQVLVQTSVGTVKELEPRSYQLNKQGGRTEVACSYALVDGNTIRFKLKNYSPDATLVIDPTEVFCSFTGSKSDNWGYTATYDDSGNFYAGGIVLDETRQNPSGPGGGGFPVSTGAYQSGFQGGDGSEGDGYSYDVAIMKFSTNGGTRLYATYLGGAGDEQPHSMICDPQGNLVVTGRTSSANFPTTAGASLAGSGFDLFVTKLNASGTGLIGSIRMGGSGDDGVNYAPKYLLGVSSGGVQQPPLGGAQELRLNYGDDGRSEVILDDANNIYIAACTKSTDFPVQGAFQPTSGGGQDGVLLKINPTVSGVLFSSYLGGSGSDAAFVLALNPLNSDIYVGGGTLSSNLKGTAGSLQPSNNGGVDGFVAIVANDGSSLKKTTYFGTTGTDMIYGVQFDKNGFPYIMGTTSGLITPVNSPFNQNANQAGGKQFITKLKSDLSGIVYSANFGPSNLKYPCLSPTAFLVDRCENVYVSGWGGGADITDNYQNSGTTGLTPTSGALKSSTDGKDFYFFVLQKNAASQLYGSFFGQTGGNFGDHVDGGTSRFDKQGIVYQAICANCYGGAVFPTTPGVWASTNGTGVNGCNEAAVKISFNFSGVSAGLKSVLDGRGDSIGCVPLQVTFQDTIRNAKSYIWDFGDGSADTSTVGYIVNHTYTRTGTFLVTLIAIDSNTCNVADTVYKNITVKDNQAYLNFNYKKVGPCDALSYDFSNLSTAPAPAQPFGDSSFVWIFGDQPNRTIPAGPVTSVTNYSFPAPGTYNVSLLLVDTNYCNYPDTLTKQLFIAANVKAQFETPAIGCAPYFAVFNNTSIAGQQYYWDFGDGTFDSTNRTPPPHLYPNPGTVTVKLTVVDSNTCNIIDSFKFTITLQGKPTAGFSFTPSPPVPNTPTIFQNQSSTDAVQFTWLFGDGTSATKLTLDTVIHQYNKTDTFQACLIAVNRAGCADTVCHPVAVLINPLLDVPNAFTPGRFGVNGIVKVVGFGISHMVFRIYNRWGQMVFQSNDPYIGWDGTYKGTLQPMDVYAYTLEAEFSDGTHASKKGDITLIR